MVGLHFEEKQINYTVDCHSYGTIYRYISKKKKKK